MNSLIVVGEDGLCCALGAKLVQDLLPEWNVAIPPINKGGITKLIPDLPKFCKLAKSGRPVLCIADVDRRCAVQLVQRWLPHGKPALMLLRLAVPEAESWLLADQEGLQRLIEVPTHKIPHEPEVLIDAKQQLLGLINRYGTKTIRREMVINEPTHLIAGTGYNQHLKQFVQEHWRPQRAATRSPSLQRAIKRIAGLGQLSMTS
jgi:hypothetical protein